MTTEIAHSTFSDILQNTVGSGERPKPLPSGTYQLRVRGFKLDKSELKKTPYVRFLFSVEQAKSDVQLDLLSDIDLTKKELRADFYLTQAAQYRLDDWLLLHIGLNGGGRTLGQLIPEAVGRPVIGNVVQVPSSKPNDPAIYNEITSFSRWA